MRIVNVIKKAIRSITGSNEYVDTVDVYVNDDLIERLMDITTELEKENSELRRRLSKYENVENVEGDIDGYKIKK